MHHAVVTDNTMPGIKGHEMAQFIKIRSPSTPIVMFTGLTPPGQSWLDCIIQRPDQTHLLLTALEELL